MTTTTFNPNQSSPPIGNRCALRSVKNMKPFLLLMTCLLIWKVVRTDWRIETTEFRGHINSGEIIRSYTSYTPKISPLWDRPRPVEHGREIESWDKAIHLWFGSGSMPPCVSELKINYSLILFKTLPFLLLYGLIITVLSIRRGIKNKPNKSQHPTASS